MKTIMALGLCSLLLVKPDARFPYLGKAESSPTVKHTVAVTNHKLEKEEIDLPSTEGAVGVQTDDFTAYWADDGNWFMCSTNNYEVWFDMQHTWYMIEESRTVKCEMEDHPSMTMLACEPEDLLDYIGAYKNLKGKVLSVSDDMLVIGDREIYYDDGKITSVNSRRYLYEPIEVPDFSDAYLIDYGVFVGKLSEE